MAWMEQIILSKVGPLAAYSSDPVIKNKKNLNRKAAKYAKLKTLSRGIVQNRDTVLDKAAFSFAVHPANEKTFLPSFVPFAP